MPHYRYKAATSGNEVIEEVIEAESEQSVLAYLRASGVVPLEVRPVRSGGNARFVVRMREFLTPARPRIRHKDLRVFTEQLANLLGAGLPLDRSLRLMGNVARGPVAELLNDLLERVRGGSALADALDAHVDVFPRSYTRIVHAGEVGGTLAENLARLDENLERVEQLRERIVSALIYPVLLLVLSAVSLVILLTFVVPRFAPIFDDLDAELPLLTRVILLIAETLHEHGLLVILFVIAVTISVRLRRNTAHARQRRARLLLGVPIVAALVTRLEVARFTRTLGTLLDNGVSVLSALSIAGEVLRNEAFAADVAAAREYVKTGSHLSTALAEGGRFPPLALQMIQVGEETGSLARMLLRVADIHEREGSALIDRLMAMLVPAVTLGLAVLIGLIVVSILIPILNMSRLLL